MSRTWTHGKYFNKPTELIDLFPICGVYAIVNKRSGRAYIGKSSNVIVRLSDHVKELVSGNHHNKELLADFNQYGYAGFSFTILERCVIDLLTDRERARIIEYSGLSGVYNSDWSSLLERKTWENRKNE